MGEDIQTQEQLSRRLTRFLEKTMRQHYFGSVKIQFIDGRAVHIEMSQTFKPDTLPEN